MRSLLRGEKLPLGIDARHGKSIDMQQQWTQQEEMRQEGLEQERTEQVRMTQASMDQASMAEEERIRAATSYHAMPPAP
eukprot:5795338-Lingulodinium_polyedra.AAC.1